jgi:hypothetical protein
MDPTDKGWDLFVRFYEDRNELLDQIIGYCVFNEDCCKELRCAINMIKVNTLKTHISAKLHKGFIC